MNNYCTNCGKKLNEKDIKCSECNTYVVDLKKINKKKIFNIIVSFIFILILVIIIFVIGYNFYFKNLHKALYNKYLKNDYINAEFVKYNSCRACDGSCDGACINSPKIVGCFQYFYKSNKNSKDIDIMIISNKGKVVVDNYNSIIIKYGFKISSDDDDYEYLTSIRSNLYIDVDSININNIKHIYNMISELIENYKKYGDEELYIRVYDNNEYSNSISVESVNGNYDFEWKINGSALINPSFQQVQNKYIKTFTYNGDINND